MLILFSACGVKSAPQKYPEKAIPSYLEEYTHEEVHEYIKTQTTKKK
jgi:hypothetical protein